MAGGSHTNGAAVAIDVAHDALEAARGARQVAREALHRVSEVEAKARGETLALHQRLDRIETSILELATVVDTRCDGIEGQAREHREEVVGHLTSLWTVAVALRDRDPLALAPVAGASPSAWFALALVAALVVPQCGS